MFEVTITKGRGDDQEIWGKVIGPLKWHDGKLKVTLYDDEARCFTGNNKVADTYVMVETDAVIKYIPPGGDPEALGKVSDGSFEKHYRKPTPWVSIRGIDPRYDDNDVKEALKKELADEENDVEANIVDFTRRDGKVYVKFGLVFEAEGCETMLNGENLLGGRIEVRRVAKTN